MRIRATLEQVNEAIQKIRQDGGTVYIEESAGSIEARGVRVSFTFDQEEQILAVQILDKPWLASDSMIEDAIRNFFK
jgi:hypothetical protein